MSQSLYELTNEFINAEQAMINANLDEQVIKDTLDGIELEIEDKIRYIGRWIKNSESLAAAIKEQEESMKARRQAIEKRNERLRSYIVDAMKAVDKSAYEYPEFKVSVRKGRGTVEVIDVSKIPMDYMRIKPAPAPEPNKEEILKAWKAGIEVNGVNIVFKDTAMIK